MHGSSFFETKESLLEMAKTDTKIDNDTGEEKHECVSCHKYFFLEEMQDHPAGYYCNGCYDAQ